MTLIKSDGETVKVDLPTRLKPFGLLATTDRHLVVQLAASAQIAGSNLPAETLLAYDVTATASDRNRVQVVYSPHDGEYLTDSTFGVDATRDAVHFIVTRKLVPHLISASPGPHGWTTNLQLTADAGQSLKVGGGDLEGSDLIVQTTGFLTPTRLELWHPGSKPTLLQSETPAFDAASFVVEVRSAQSKDGTAIDYFLLRPREVHAGTPAPTLMTGYGAFGITFTPGYLDGEVGGRSLKGVRSCCLQFGAAASAVTLGTRPQSASVARCLMTISPQWPSRSSRAASRRPRISACSERQMEAYWLRQWEPSARICSRQS
jgi:prolyl oligopeptidase